MKLIPHGVRPLYGLCQIVNPRGVRPLYGLCQIVNPHGVRPLCGHEIDPSYGPSTLWSLSVKQLTLVGFFVKQLTLVGFVHFVDMKLIPRMVRPRCGLCQTVNLRGVCPLCGLQ